MKLEWANGVQSVANEGVAGAERFAQGAGRQGSFEDI